VRQEDGGLHVLNADRIAHLVDVDGLRDTHVLCLGLGSLGFPVLQHLAMSGVRRWTLIDREALEPENLVKHPAMRAQLGEQKTAIGEAWILDRNPAAQIDRLDVDVTHGDGRAAFEAAVAAANLLIVTTDNRQSRLVASRTAVQHGTPMVVGTVFRTGFGGDAYLYDAASTGCYECFLADSEHVTVARAVADAKAAAEVEDVLQNARYGRVPDPKYGLSGLASDIGAVASLVARFAMAVLMDGAVNETLQNAMQHGGPALSQAELHMLRVPYDLKGPHRPDEPSTRTVWLDTSDGQRYGAQPLCGGCRSRVDPLEDRFCSWCGERLLGVEHDEGGPDQEGVEVLSAWRPIPPAPHGHGINHVSVITRRHLIDDATMGHNGTTVETGNVRLALQPFEMRTSSIAPGTDCPWCAPSEEDEP